MSSDAQERGHGGSREIGKTVAIVQSSYIPWKGYFDLINMADEFILLDDVQYTRRDWRNRNRIKSSGGSVWLTIPVAKGDYHQRIDETTVSDPTWFRRHWEVLRQCYASAAHFKTHGAFVEELYSGCRGERYLSRINRLFIVAICDLLGITTEISRSSDYSPTGRQTERLVSICERTGASTYLSGPTARAYLDERAFELRGIEVQYIDYTGYPAYPQVHPPFDHHVSIVDLILNTGATAPMYLKTFAGTERRLASRRG